MIKTYSELTRFQTFEERLEYLKLKGLIGEDTFGFDRYLNQMFYKTSTWKRLKDQIIIRDNGCNLGIIGYELFESIYIHHMNPISKNDILNNTEYLTNPEYLICCSLRTHNDIHYSRKTLLGLPEERTIYDTCPWKK